MQLLAVYTSLGCGSSRFTLDDTSICFYIAESVYILGFQAHTQLQVATFGASRGAWGALAFSGRRMPTSLLRRLHVKLWAVSG